MDEMDRIARFYDLDWGQVTYDITFYQNYARLTGSPILELGVGTGRVAISLAQAGFMVMGVDFSETMLGIAQGKLQEPWAGRLQLVRADMRDFRLGGRFNLAFIALGTFAHITDPQDQINVFERVHAHLAEGGLFILSLEGPAALVEGNGEVALAFSKDNPDTGGNLCKFVSSVYDRAHQMEELTFIYDETGEDGLVRRTTASFALRHFSRREVELLLERCGFEVEKVYGSYDLDNYTEESQHMIFLARKNLGRQLIEGAV